MNYKETIKFLYNNLTVYYIHGKRAYKPGLKNILKLDLALNNPHKNYRIVHIGGTNGKGTTAHGISRITNSNNIKTGLYTSPHIKDFRERIRVNEKKISKKYIISFIKSNIDLIKNIRPSFFEITTMMALSYFKYKKVDLAIIEVGLGGRLDSTNIINSFISIITNISYDHQNILGNKLINIANEKSGIIKKNSIFIKGEKQNNIDSIFVKKCNKLKTKYIKSYENVEITSLNKNIFKRKINVKTNNLQFILNIKPPTNYYLKNIPSIINASNIILKKFKIKITKNSFSGLENLINKSRLRGRWQIHSKKPLIISDGCHNIESINNVINELNSYKYEKVYFIIGGVKDKKWEKIIKILPNNFNYIISEPNNKRAIDSNKLSVYFKKNQLNHIVIKEVNDAIFYCKNKLKSNKELIFIGGSFFLISDINEK